MLYRHYYGYAMGISLRYSNSREDAGEIVNDGFLKVFDKLGQFQPENSFKAWLGKIMVNTAIDHYRRNINRFALMDISKADNASADPNIIDQLSEDDILQVLRSLPELLRIVFNLHEIEGYSHEEIGNQIGVPASTCRTYLARAKRKMREKIIELNHINNEGAIR